MTPHIHQMRPGRPCSVCGGFIGEGEAARYVIGRDDDLVYLDSLTPPDVDPDLWP